MEDNVFETPTTMNSTVPQASLLVSGATGYLGSRVVELLSSENGIVAVYRNRVPDPKPNLFPIAADLLSKDLLTAPLRGINTVIHLAWENKNPPPVLKELEGPFNAFEESSNIVCLRNLLEAMEAAKTPRIIFVSAVGAHRDAKEPFLREKYRCEQMIINSAVKEKIIIRISPLFGHHKDGGFVQVVKKFMKYQFFYPFPNFKDPISPLHVDDLVDLISKCSKVKMYDFCAIVDLVGGELYSASQIFNIVARQFNKNMFPVGTFVGNTFIKILERKNEKQELKISDYFIFGSRIEKKIRHKNPLSKLLPEKCRTFQEEYFSAR